MKEVKKASEGKILASVIDNKLIIADRVQAPKGKDLSQWIEFNNVNEAKIFFNISEEKEVE